MRKYFLTGLFQLLVCQFLFSQAQVRKLPAIINHPSLNLYAPFISADGNALLFTSDNGGDGVYVVSYTSRDPDWTAPAELPKYLSNRLNFLRGYALSGDGKKIYVTSAKSPVVGGYDIFAAELKGTTWSQPENLMMPINSKGNEGCPSFTPDGNTMYFMRCDKMDQVKAEGCKIFMSKKKNNGQWDEPVELPASVNNGNSQTPRIMADGETLIFSSDKMTPNKGGMDLYLCRFKNGKWSEPVPLEFLNSEKDDQYVSVSAVGRHVLKEEKGTRNNFELTEFLLPMNLRPKGLTKVEGKIEGATGAIPSYIAVTDIQSGKRIFSGKPAPDGSYFFYLQEGSVYELSVDPEQSNISYFAKVFDLRSEKISQKEKVNVTLKEPAPGDEFMMELVSFKPHSSDLEPLSLEELGRFSRMAKSNPDLKFEIHLTLLGYKQDSVQSSPDLTEVKFEPLEMVMDSVQDSTQQETIKPVAKVTYHNDRTLKQAQAINAYLTKEGLKPEQISFVVKAEESEDELPVLTIKAIVK
jgi:hypothetical protein